MSELHNEQSIATSEHKIMWQTFLCAEEYYTAKTFVTSEFLLKDS